MLFTMCSLSHNNHGMSGSFFKMVPLVTLLLITGANASSCRRKLTRQTITYENCLPKTILTYACAGSCHSASHVDNTSPLVLVHTCSQCREASVVMRRVRVSCPDSASTSGFTRQTIPVAVPGACQCESCSFNDVITMTQSNK